MSLPSSAQTAQTHTIPVSVEAYDKLCLKMSYLHALVVSISAEDFSSFDCLTERLRHNLIWLINDLAGDAEKAREQLTEGIGHD